MFGKMDAEVDLNVDIGSPLEMSSFEADIAELHREVNLNVDIGSRSEISSFEADIAELHQSGLLDLSSLLDIPGTEGIQATDMGSLLEQFEDASQTDGDCDLLQPSLLFDWNQNKLEDFSDSCSKGTDKVVNGNTLSKKLLNKTRDSNKRKSAIMLPMGIPSKRCRGRAVTLPANCTSRKLQKVVMQNSELKSMLPFVDKSLNEKVADHDSNSNFSSISETDSNKENKLLTNPEYFDAIPDHDYCQSSPTKPQSSLLDFRDAEENAIDIGTEVEIEQDINNGNLNIPTKAVDNSGTTMLENSNECNSENVMVDKNKGTVKKIEQVFTPAQIKQLKAKRNYRKKASAKEIAAEEINDKFFDKIPSYYTALSIPSILKKKEKVEKAKGSGITLKDFIERDPSPTRDSSMYNKLPAYHNCFTNSTKYDSAKGRNEATSVIVIDNDKVSTSAFSSSSHTPVTSNSKRFSRSRSRSYSQSSSRSSSGSSCESRKRKWKRSYSRSHSRSYSRSRSRSRTFRYRSRSPLSRSRSRSYSSRSRSRSRSPGWYRSRKHRYRHSRSRSKSLKRERSRSRERRLRISQYRENRKEKQMAQRRIMYVGRIPDGYTKAKLRRRFGMFGEIEDVRLHFREHGDNYGFVTFVYTCDAYAAIEKGNDIAGENFDLCFGGRRQFCKTDYADLDGIREYEEEYDVVQSSAPLDFDSLLRQAKSKAKR